MSQPADWTAERERSNLWALRLIRWIAMTAGRSATRWLLHPITLYYLVANGKARSASRLYLGRALGRPATWTDVYRHIHRFAATILDRVYFLQGRHDAFELTHSGTQAVHASLDRGQGVMLAGAHLGSFEALRAIGLGRGVRVAMLMYEDNAKLLNATLAAIAPRAELQTIALGRPGAMLALRRCLDEGGLAGLLADRTLPAAAGRTERSRTHVVDFLGHPARFSDGPFRLAALLRRKVVFMTGLYGGGNRYDLRFVELADFGRDEAVDGETGVRADPEQRVEDTLRRYVALLESLCRESPYNWFNFYDFWAAPHDDRQASPSPSSPR